MSRAYRVLVRLYPRSFRDAYGDDMVLLFEDQRADDGALRAWSRTARDLLVTIPTQHLEVLVHRRSPRLVSSAVGLLGIVVLVAGVIIGSAVSPLLLLVGVVLAVAGAMAWQQHRDVVAPELVESWWKVLLAGPAVLASVVLAHAVWPPSLEPGDDVAWLLTFSSIILAITLIVSGVLLGAVQGAARLRR